MHNSTSTDSTSFVPRSEQTQQVEAKLNASQLLFDCALVLAPLTVAEKAAVEAGKLAVKTVTDALPHVTIDGAEPPTVKLPSERTTQTGPRHDDNVPESPSKPSARPGAEPTLPSVLGGPIPSGPRDAQQQPPDRPGKEPTLPVAHEPWRATDGVSVPTPPKDQSGSPPSKQEVSSIAEGGCVITDKNKIDELLKELQKTHVQEDDQKRFENLKISDIQAAKERLDAKADDPQRELSKEERKTLKAIEHSICNGDLESMEAVLGRFKDDPTKLNQVMRYLREDMHALGVDISWDTGDVARGAEAMRGQFHTQGTMRIICDNEKKYMETVVDKDIIGGAGSGVGGPVHRNGDGYIINFLAYNDDPRGLLKNAAYRAATGAKATSRLEEMFKHAFDQPQIIRLKDLDKSLNLNETTQK